MKNMFFFWMGVLLICGSIEQSACAEGRQALEEQIVQARKLALIDQMSRSPKAIDKDSLKAFLKDKDPWVRMISVRALVRLDKNAALEFISSAESDNAWFVRRAARVEKVVRNLESQSPSQRMRFLANLAKDRPATAKLLSQLFLEKGWAQGEELKKQIPALRRHVSSLQAWGDMAGSLDRLPPKERKKRALADLLERPSIVHAEQALLALVQLDKDVIPDLLAALNDKENIPKAPGPPWTTSHTNYHYILKALKSIPDERSIPILEKLAGQPAPHIKEEAQEALTWIRSGVPYPVQFEKDLAVSDDDVPPGESR